ncbi:MarR family winged helix-turn-helix transcriptional regulator [Parablastomonas sp. CN1-191]|uniref:MarR family winged helix-turn-helix transcriptional regulator n=1 Tax=Parablastomonas sp. CN1-191 TaxID=3400908 RepID=UPI003BF79CC1
MPDRAPLQDADYAALANLRHTLRQFLAFSERRAGEHGLTSQQHQALLAIRGATGPVTVGYVADRLILRPHSATGLVNRLAAQGLIERRASPADGRAVLLGLTVKARDLLEDLSATHREEIGRLYPQLVELLGKLA